MELEITELTLGLPGWDNLMKKRGFSDMYDDADHGTSDSRQKVSAKSLVVGWPPVCSYRRKNSFNEEHGVEVSKMYVKISMDGAPFLRKIDLSLHNGYSDLAMALEELFGCYGLSEALKEADSSEYVPIYEDRDGDWMLAGDVPWGMFIESCKRIRIMKRSEAKGFWTAVKRNS